jgi:hypothetical protein
MSALEFCGGRARENGIAYYGALQTCVRVKMTVEQDVRKP